MPTLERTPGSCDQGGTNAGRSFLSLQLGFKHNPASLPDSDRRRLEFDVVDASGPVITGTARLFGSDRRTGRRRTRSHTPVLDLSGSHYRGYWRRKRNPVLTWGFLPGRIDTGRVEQCCGGNGDNNILISQTGQRHADGQIGAVIRDSWVPLEMHVLGRRMQRNEHQRRDETQ